MPLHAARGFHGYADIVRDYQIDPDDSDNQGRRVRKHFTIEERKLRYRFENHFHPYTAELIERLIEKSVAGLQATDTEYSTDSNGRPVIPADKPSPEDYALYQEFFQKTYEPSPGLVDTSYPVKELDFSSGSAYGVYNWELFYHIPLTVAIHLSRNQRYEEAMGWFHYIFDPTDNSDGPTPERFWKVKPFQTTDVKKIEELLINLSSGQDERLRQETINSINAWKDAPFRPHVVARYRQSAYMFKTVMAYLDNLIAWGDGLFRQDTGESINEATQLYVMAANILGPRPQMVPKKGSVRPQTYANLKQDLDAFGNVLRELETEVPFDNTPHPTDVAEIDRISTLRSMGTALYFCVPRNDKLLAYWDTVADRLFKIRNSLNIQGVFRQLPLFEPPIDPGLLARASAAGVDIGGIISGLNQPLPLVRFQLLIQRATEICQEVKSLGNNLLSTMEKEDNEKLAVLRAQQERVILTMVETVRYGQWQEAIKAREGLEQSLANTVQRYVYYERQLGQGEDDIDIPELDNLDKAELERMRLRLREPSIAQRDIEVDIASELNASGGKIISSWEKEELDKLSSAQLLQEVAQGINAVAKAVSLIPEIKLNLHYWGIGTTQKIISGEKMSRIVSYGSDIASFSSNQAVYKANRAAKVSSYARREQEWAFQSNVIAGEITLIYKQLRAAQIREAIAEREWKNHQQQIRHAEEIELFLTDERTGKKTNQAFYAWMKREVKGLYGQCFQFAFDVAKKAERALQHELGDPELSFVQFGYLAGKEGLLAGEKLYLDLKRMEMAYHDLYKREYELTKHISLLQLEPMALVELRTTGRCEIELPESLFDMDGPGHYFRRIKTVAVSIPCVTGPYTSVNCTLRLVKSSIRKNSLLDTQYSRAGDEDDRFSDYFGRVESIVTSSAQNDSGLFETNLRDERYLPFENAGVISRWQLELPADPSQGEPTQFDYDTISDVILHIRYMAREGGTQLRSGAIAHIQKQIESAEAPGTVRLFSVRHEFPTEWAKFQMQTPDTSQRAELTINLRPEHYPFWSQGRLNSVENVAILVQSRDDAVLSEVNVANIVDKGDNTALQNLLAENPSLGGLLSGNLTAIPLPASPVGELTLFFDHNIFSDLWIVVTWSS